MSFRLVDLYDEIRSPTAPVFLVEGLIEDCTTGGIIGKTGSGKSFVAVSLACCAVTGISFAGKAMIKKGVVVYLAGEGRQGISRRVLAWQEFHQIEIPEGKLFISSTNLQVDRKGAQVLTNELDQLVSDYGKPVLIIIDTLIRALPSGRDENSSKDMMAFLNEIDKIRDRYSCVVLIVHHTGHGSSAKDRARGSSSFLAALDFEFLLDARKKRFEATKMKEAELPMPLSYQIVGAGDSAVVVFGEDVANIQRTELTKSEVEALVIFKESCSSLSRSELTSDEWREAYRTRFPSKNSAAIRQAFGRAKIALVEKGRLQLKEGLYSLCDSENFP